MVDDLIFHLNHLKTKKYKTAKNATSFSSTHTFFNNLKVDDSSLKPFTFVYHTTTHNQSFNSMKLPVKFNL